MNPPKYTDRTSDNYFYLISPYDRSLTTKEVLKMLHIKPKTIAALAKQWFRALLQRTSELSK